MDVRDKLIHSETIALEKGLGQRSCYKSYYTESDLSRQCTLKTIWSGARPHCAESKRLETLWLSESRNASKTLGVPAPNKKKRQLQELPLTYVFDTLVRFVVLLDSQNGIRVLKMHPMTLP